jgi:hypothetical protein
MFLLSMRFSQDYTAGEQLKEEKLTGKTKVLRENPPQCHTINHKSHKT